MYTVIYMSETGKIEEKKFETLQESRAFFEDLATKAIPTVVPEDVKSHKKTRIEELDGLISTNRNALLKLSCDKELLKKLVDDRVRYEIERHSLQLLS